VFAALHVPWQVLGGRECIKLGNVHALLGHIVSHCMKLPNSRRPLTSSQADAIIGVAMTSEVRRSTGIVTAWVGISMVADPADPAKKSNFCKRALQSTAKFSLPHSLVAKLEEHARGV
jgi:hypothetical protein